MHTLFELCGLFTSMSGDKTSPFDVGKGDFNSCASSSISVDSVPFESTGDGSTCIGYGLGGASESEGPDNLLHMLSSATIKRMRDMRTSFLRR
jgi:hypothetical protein